MRAISEEERDGKRRVLVSVARMLLGDMEYEGITIDRIAREACIAKGSVFLSFRSKEELFLALAEEEYRRWFDRIAAGIDDLHDAGDDPLRLAEVLFDSFARTPVLAKLMAVAPVVLEAGTELPALIRFKGNLFQGLHALAEKIGPRLSAPAETAAKRLFRSYSVLVGLLATSRIREDLRAALEKDKNLSVFALDFRAEFLALAPEILKPRPRSSGEAPA